MKKYLLLTALLMLPKMALATVSGSSGTRNGGNIYVAAFYQFAADIGKALESLNTDQDIDVQWIQRLLPILKVEASATDLTLDGMNVNAINYPSENRIIFSQEAWRKMDHAQQAQLVIHELLGLSGNTDVNYQNSSSILQLMGSSSSYDNRLFSGSQSCAAARTISGAKAQAIMRSMIIAGVQGGGLQNLTCRRSVSSALGNKSDVDCTSGNFSPAAAEILTNAMSSLGLWNQRDSKLESYSIEKMQCQSNPAKNTYTCDVQATWAWGCPASTKPVVGNLPKIFSCAIYHGYREKNYQSSPGQQNLGLEKFIVENLGFSMRHIEGGQQLEAQTYFDKDTEMYISVYESPQSTYISLDILPKDSDSTVPVAGFPLTRVGASIDTGYDEVPITYSWDSIETLLAQQAQSSGLPVTSLVYSQSKLVCKPEANQLR